MGSLVVLNEGPTDLAIVGQKTESSTPPELVFYSIKKKTFMEIPRTVIQIGISAKGD